MVRAMKAMSVYSKAATGMRCERANSRSKAMAVIGLRNNVKNRMKGYAQDSQQCNVTPVDGQNIAEQEGRRSGVNPGAREAEDDTYCHTKCPKYRNGRIFPHVTALAKPFHSESGQHREYGRT